jgi:hypothetical protein
MSLLFYPAVQLLGEGRQVKEEVLCWLKNRRLPINFRARIDQIGGIELATTLIALITTCFIIATDRTSTFDVAVG